jgi:hypothetical protein
MIIGTLARRDGSRAKNDEEYPGGDWERMEDAIRFDETVVSLQTQDVTK